VHRLAEAATLGWREIPSLTRGQYISQLLVGPTGSDGALMDLVGLLERPSSSKVASTVGTRIRPPSAGR
jgi:hypothetical protein